MWSSYLNNLSKLVMAFFGVLLFANHGFASIPQVWNVPAENPHFVGRLEILNTIDDIFKNAALKVAVVTGPSGFGKSQIAKSYAYKNYTQYDVIWWFKGNQYLDQQFENFALALDSYLNLSLSDKIKTIGPAKLVNDIKDALRKNGIKCLRIFDDAQKYKDIETYIPFNHERNVHILITTKNANLSDTALRLATFLRQESIDYIQRFLPHESKEAQDKLASHLGDCPSSLAVATDYIKNYPGMTIATYLQKHDTEAKSSPKQRQEAALRLGSSTNGYEMDLMTALKLNLGELKLSSRMAYKLVGFLSLLHHDAIATDDINKWLAACHSNQDTLELIHMINQYSLLDTPNPSEGHGNLKMHELIQKIVASLIPVEEKKEHLATAVDLLKDFFRVRTDQVVEKVIKDNTPLLHAVKISDEADKINYHSSELTSLRIKILDVLVGHVRDYDRSKILVDHLQRDLESQVHLSKEDEIIYNTTMFLFSLVFSPDYVNGISYGKKALALVEDEEGMFEEKIRLYSNLLQYCSLTGRLDESQIYVSKGEACFDRSKSDAYNALFVFAVSMYFNDKGEFDKTIELIERNQPLLSRQDSYPSMRFFILNQLAEALVKKGNVDESLKVLARAEKLGREFYPHENNSFLGKWYVLKALCQLSQSELYQAKESLDQALKIFEKIYLGSGKHRNQGLAHLLLGEAHYLSHGYDQAQEHFLKSEEIYNKLFKHHNIEDVSELYKMLAMLGADIKDEGLTHTYLKKQLEVFGPEHQKTKDIIVYLDEKGLGIPL